MQLVKSEKNGQHWYRQNSQGVWEGVYEVPKKDGTGMKATTLREAREMGLLPSVTSIIDVLSKPALTSWLVEQGIMAALTLPRLPGETDDAFAKRVVEDSEAQSEKAREFGTAIHDAVESYLNPETFLKPVDIDFALLPYLSGFQDWSRDNIEEVYAVEQIVGNAALGYAGRLDVHCKMRTGDEAIIDIKTQRVKSNSKGKKPVFYPEWLLQLVAYQKCITEDRHLKLANVIIDSGEPGLPHVKGWLPEEANAAWEMFQHCLKLWQWQNNYVPEQRLF